MAAILLRLALCASVIASFSASAAGYKAAQQTVVIYGATGGGFGAAISAAREQAEESGHVVLISLSSHVGGMVTGGLQVHISLLRGQLGLQDRGKEGRCSCWRVTRLRVPFSAAHGQRQCNDHRRHYARVLRTCRETGEPERGERNSVPMILFFAVVVVVSIIAPFPPLSLLEPHFH